MTLISYPMKMQFGFLNNNQLYVCSRILIAVDQVILASKCMPFIMQVQPTLSHTGFIVAFSLLVVKSWRTYRIFHNTKLTDKVRDNCFLTGALYSGARSTRDKFHVLIGHTFSTSLHGLHVEVLMHTSEL